MNLLVDLLTASGKCGAGEYLRRVLFEILERASSSDSNNVKIYALYDSKKGISYEDLKPDSLGYKYGICFLDIHQQSITSIISDYKIDRFFIACGQRIGEYPDISYVSCDTICVIHDLLYEEWFSNDLEYYWRLCRPPYRQMMGENLTLCERFSHYVAYLGLAKHILRLRFQGQKSVEASSMRYIANVSKMLDNNPLSSLVMVSEYSKMTMTYHYGTSPNRITVLYSPERIISRSSVPGNSILSDLIASGKKYYLMVSAGRDCKNGHKLIRAFERYTLDNKDSFLVIIGYQYGVSSNIINLPYLSDGDIELAYKNCYALVYPTFFEGFGYPPIEAMKYSKPVICSNVTSLPEILGDAPIYFSPIYESAIFQALSSLTSENYHYYSSLSYKHYQVVRQRQEQDLKKLVQMIMAPIKC